MTNNINWLLFGFGGSVNEKGPFYAPFFIKAMMVNFVETAGTISVYAESSIDRHVVFNEHTIRRPPAVNRSCR